MLDCFSFKNMMFDLPSSAVLDKGNTIDYIRRYFNLDFVFAPGDPIVWSKLFEPENTAIIAFSSGKESLLTLGVCLELGLEPILVNIVEPSNTYENKHKQEILRGIQEEFGVECYTVPHEVGLFHDAKWMCVESSTLGWGTTLLYYQFILLPFVFHHRARYLLFGNEFSSDEETNDGEGFRTNYCYDQSSHWTRQLDIAIRLLTGGSARVCSLVGPLNEIAVTKCLHHGFPRLAKYQMSCFCDDPLAEEHRWCCNCSKCARNYAFMKALGVDVERLGFWRDMFSEDCLGLFSAFEGKDTFGFDRSGLGRDEQELALYLAHENDPGNAFLNDFMKRSRYNGENGNGRDAAALLKKDYVHYLGVQEYQYMPEELRDRVYKIYNRILGIEQE
jgi:hypothetical protein